jgi:hypothetical protein
VEQLVFEGNGVVHLKELPPEDVLIIDGKVI